MTIALNTPEQIQGWVWASRVSQCHLHLKGIKVPGLAAWLKANVPECANLRTVEQMYPRLLDHCDEIGHPWNQSTMNRFQVLVTAPVLYPLYIDEGVYETLDDISEKYGPAYAQGRVIIIRTMEKMRDRDPDKNMIYQG